MAVPTTSPVRPVQWFAEMYPQEPDEDDAAYRERIAEEAERYAQEIGAPPEEAAPYAAAIASGREYEKQDAPLASSFAPQTGPAARAYAQERVQTLPFYGSQTPNVRPGDITASPNTAGPLAPGDGPANYVQPLQQVSAPAATVPPLQALAERGQSAAASATPDRPSAAGYPSYSAPAPHPLQILAQRRVELPEPPMLEGPNPAAIGLAAFADMLLNKGQHAGVLLGELATGGEAAAQQNYENQLRRAQLQSGMDARYAQAARARIGESPEAMELRRRSLELRERSLGTTENREARLERQWQEMNDPASESAKRAYEIAVAGGIDPAAAEGKTAAELSRLSPAVNEYFKNTGGVGAARTAHAAEQAQAVAEAVIDPKTEQARRTAAATQPYKMELAEAQAGLREEGKDAEAQRQSAKQVAEAQYKRRQQAATERTQLENLRAMLAKRDPSSRLPAQGSIIDRSTLELKKKLLGGTGMSDEDSRLDTELSAMGLQTYKSRANNAPNAEKEQLLSGAFYRGNGTVESSLAAINDRLAAIEREEEAATKVDEQAVSGGAAPQSPKPRPAARAPKPAKPVQVPDDDDLGVTYR